MGANIIGTQIIAYYFEGGEGGGGGRGGEDYPKYVGEIVGVGDF